MCSGLTLTFLQRNHGWTSLAAYRFVIVGYASFGLVKFAIYSLLSPEIEPLHPREVAAHRDWFSKFGLHRAESRAVVFKLSCLFILDAFAGGFVMQSIIVYCESKRERHAQGAIRAGMRLRLPSDTVGSLSRFSLSVSCSLPQGSTRSMRWTKSIWV